MNFLNKNFIQKYTLAFVLAGYLPFISAQLPAQETTLIPQPQSVRSNGNQAFPLNELQGVLFPVGNTRAREIGNLLRVWFQPETSNRIAIGTDPVPGATISLWLDPSIGTAETYRIRVGREQILLEGATEAGLMAGAQTLRQLVSKQDSISVIPALDIDDSPAFGWRGAHLDVGRHFMPMAKVKEYLDVMALYKLNVFHWHLTEDQGWRIEIKKYPELTRTGAWRKEADGSRHGGFYTQKQVREIVEYARVRGIEVVPEIEMPGHCVAALAAYPELSCTGTAFKVPHTWGVFSDVFCAGKDSTFIFLENVLSEILPLFPSNYVHIGGDEVPKTRWHNCARCQQRMQQESLKDEHELQRYFVQRIEKFLQSKGKQLVGWDEILEGGLSQTALVEVWRGPEQALAAAQNGNRYLTTNYFDGSPGNNTLEKVYGFEVTPAALSAAQKEKCLGAECCLWTERVHDYMLMPMFLPRVAAFAEAVWSPGGKNFRQFKQRLDAHYALYRKLEWNYGPEDKHFFQSAIRYNRKAGEWEIRTERGMPDVEVSYNWNNFEKTGAVLNDTLRLRQPGTIVLQAQRGGKPFSEGASYTIATHRALGKDIKLDKAAHEKYGTDRNSGLVDGLLGSAATFNDGVWQGWWGEDLDARIDLGAPQAFSKISISFFQQGLSWVVLPRTVVFSVSDDGKKWREVSRTDLDSNPNDPAVFKKTVDYTGAVAARFIRVQATGYGVLPEGHNGAGGKAWIFADEIVID